VFFVLSAPALAKDWLSFNRASARPGDTVRAETSYSLHGNQLVVYLLPLAASPRFWSIGYTNDYDPDTGPPPHVRGAIHVGVTHAHGRAASLTFRLPRVRPGTYVLGVWCKPCNTHWTSGLPNYQPDPHGLLRVR
jgi:hypothetical protein